MDIKLCNTSDPKNKVKKSVTSGATFSCVLKEGTSVFNPVVIIQTDASVYNFNYMQIPTFGRFYFITDIRSIGNNRWEVSGHVDVLNTYSSGILNNDAVVRRQESVYNLYLDDPNFQIYNNERIQCIQFEPSDDLSKTLQYVIVTDNKPSAAAKKEGGEEDVSETDKRDEIPGTR